MTLKQFFKKRDGLWVSSTVQEMAQKAKKVKVPDHQTYDLPMEMTDREIVEKTGEFTESEALGLIQSLIERDTDGEDGVLLKNGYANLFYVKGGPVVFVLWHAGYRLWSVNDWLRGAYRWPRGHRAFRNCNFKPLSSDTSILERLESLEKWARGIGFTN